MQKKWPLYMLFITFTLPLLIAAGIYFNIDKINFNTTQKGELVDFTLSFNPKEQTKTLALNKQWRVVYLEPEKCDEKCETRKHELLQLSKALGKDQNRVYLHTTVKKSMHAQGNIGYEALKINDEHLFIVDPLGRAVIHYSPQMSTRDILQDLRKLLKNSRLG